MKTGLFLFILAVARALGSNPDADFLLRIQQAQNLLLLQGSNAQVLSEYDALILAISKAEPSLDVSKKALAQVYYQRSLIEISLSKTGLAIADLVEALEIDPSFQPASKKLMETWLGRGQFGEIRARFSQSEDPEVYAKMAEWEAAYKEVTGILELGTAPTSAALDRCLELINNTLLHVTRSYPLVYELRLKMAKKKAVVTFQNDEQVDYDDIVRDYAKFIRLAQHKSLDQYLEYSQYLLFTRGSFDESWNAVKSGLRIDNDHKPCGTLSKIYNRLQHVLKPLLEYFIFLEFLYPAGESMLDLPDEKLHGFKVNFKSVYADLTGPVTLSKRDMKAVPSSVQSLYDFLVYRALEFAAQEFGEAKLGRALPLIDVLNKLMCEASVRAKGDKKHYCGLVDDQKQPFFPKHASKIDALLRKKDYRKAQQLLAEYNKNIQKTSFFQKRWKPVQEHEHKKQQRQQQHQQEQFFRHQQYQYLQQQQQQSKFDRDKDYYKILDVSKDADERTLKKAYRAQTLKFHPDKYKGTDLSEKQIELKMQDINEAYEVLSDPEARSDYDSGGHQQQHAGGQYQQSHGGQNVHFNFDPQQFMGQFGGGGGGFQFHF